MNPERIRTINGKVIEEYYWNSKVVVYVDNRKSELTFEQACLDAEGE